VGLTYNRLPNGADYWNESACYILSDEDVRVLESSTDELNSMCLEAGQYVIDNNRFADFLISDEIAAMIKDCWVKEPPALYGRMDLAYNGSTPPKLLEFNADTPTTLVEAAVVQWYWLQDYASSSDQFNSIHEKLLWKWADLKPYITEPVFFAHCDIEEDLMTVAYLRQTAEDSNIKTVGIPITQVGWDASRKIFAGLEDEPMGTIFKLYPWEMLAKEEFWKYLVQIYPRPQWIEPIWKMMFSNKALLAILWEMYPRHKNLLAAYLDGPQDLTDYVIKPKLGREGANIRVVRAGVTLEQNAGRYGDSGWVYQEFSDSTKFDYCHATIGSWLIADQGPAGIGIRESDNMIADNCSRFVPHMIE
jgi:glutathionylspermidine synthase